MARPMAASDGLLVVDKPAGWTSHDVVARVRRLAATRKVGHAGTLDPMATGVLVLGIGRATRLLGHLALADKAYTATVRLGETTVTDDALGDVLERREAGSFGADEIAAVLDGFRGHIQQVPSSVSAVKIRGRRAYQRVRAGEEVTIPPRSVVISRLAVDRVARSGSGLDVDITVECSSGTYVRALARDIGEALHVGGHLTRLRRTRVGTVSIVQAARLDDLVPGDPGGLPIIGLDEVASAHFTSYVVADTDVMRVRNGRPLDAVLPTGSALGTAATAVSHPEGNTHTHAESDAANGVRPAPPVAMLAADGTFLALYAQRGAQATAVAVFRPA